MDGLKPVTLSIESSYFDWLEFRRSFTEWTQACFKTAPSPITYNEWTRNLGMVVDSDWKRRLDFTLYRTVEDLLNAIDDEMTILNPVHLRRLTLLKTTYKKGEKCSELLGRLVDGAKVSDLRNLTPDGLLLHLFLDKCPEREDTREIKEGALNLLRANPSVNKSHIRTAAQPH